MHICCGHMWISEDNVRELVPSFLHVSLWDQTWVIRVGSKPPPLHLSTHPVTPFDINSLIHSYVEQV